MASIATILGNLEGDADASNPEAVSSPVDPADGSVKLDL